jgi:hypothetical protein
MERRYWHRLSQETVDKIIAGGKTWGYVMENFKQPDWCEYSNALDGLMGCWTLTDRWNKNSRKSISRKFCKGCEYYKEKNHGNKRSKRS